MLYNPTTEGTMSTITTVSRISTPESLHQAVTTAVENYLKEYGEVASPNLHDKVLRDIEIPLFTYLLEQADGNQCQITRWLGLARGTVRKKMKQYDLLKKRLKNLRNGE